MTTQTKLSLYCFDVVRGDCDLTATATFHSETDLADLVISGTDMGVTYKRQMWSGSHAEVEEMIDDLALENGFEVVSWHTSV